MLGGLVVIQDHFALAKLDFAMQSYFMNPNWAEENLQTIRTLMERSALYRRALAPIMTFVGIMGIVGGLVGCLLEIQTDSGFLYLWMGMAIVSATGALLLVRRQALKDSESFWSPPTRRVVQALMPAFSIGLTLTILILIGSSYDAIYGHSDEYGFDITKILIVIWAWLYGCAIHSAGFFMPRSARWFGWMFIFIGTIMLICMVITKNLPFDVVPHVFMAAIFGGLHLAYAVYLYLTEKKNPVA